MNQKQLQNKPRADQNYYRLWPALCGDIALARETIKNLDIDVAQKAHWLLNIGAYDDANKLARQIKDRNSIVFRLIRRKGNHNPYQELFNYDAETRENIIARAERNGTILSGGIGDHIEQLSQVDMFMRSVEKRIKIITNDERYNQLNRAFPGLLHKSQKQGKNQIPVEILMAAMDKQLPLPRTILEDMNHKIENENTIVCCWNVQGKGDIYSKWSRSVTFTQARTFYTILKKKNYNLSNIVDISKWKDWESDILKNESIKLVDPSKGDLLELMKTVRSAKHVITVDTALVHVCASMNKKCHVLIPIFPDERWYKFSKPGNMYSQNCRFIRQKEYGCWKREIQMLGTIF